MNEQDFREDVLNGLRRHVRERKSKSSNGNQNSIFRKIGTVVAWLALVFSVVTFFCYTLPTQEATKERAETADARDATAHALAATTDVRAATADVRAATADARTIKLSVPMIDVAYYVFHSPDLKAEEDRREIEERGFSAVRVILTPYQQDRAGAYMHKYGPGMRYLFILFINQGGTVKNMRIRLTRWEPKENRSIPKGAGDIPSLGALPSGQAYALLVDAAQGIDALKPLRASHAEEVCVEYTYTDFADEMYRPQIRCLTDKAPFDADGVIMGIWTFMHGEEQDLEGGWEWK